MPEAKKATRSRIVHLFNGCTWRGRSAIKPCLERADRSSEQDLQPDNLSPAVPLPAFSIPQHRQLIFSSPHIRLTPPENTLWKKPKQHKIERNKTREEKKEKHDMI